MRNADLDDMKDQNYKEAVAAEWKEIRDMNEKKTQTTDYFFKRYTDVIREHLTDRDALFKLKMLEDYLTILEMKAVRLDVMHERILND